jgi:fibro-slime domain-containing protein
MRSQRARVRQVGYAWNVGRKLRAPGIAVGLAIVAAACGADDPSLFVPAEESTVGSDAGAVPDVGSLELIDGDGGLAVRSDGSPAIGSCGDGRIDKDEVCDDGNRESADGCSAACAFEAGWACPSPGAACFEARCGDGIVAGFEDCDDANGTPSDGCTACRVDPGFACPNAGKSCTRTTCGDSKKEGSEQCDDGNVVPYDGCSPSCTVEPKCSGGVCTGACGDGIRFPSEACDDGNGRSGDGCSATCQTEPGFACTEVTSALPPTLDVPIIYRDFRSNGRDFEGYCCANATGLVKNALDSQGKPELATVGSPRMLESAQVFATWYRDTPNVNSAIVSTLTLTKQPDNSYVFDSASFFPLDGKGFGNEGRSHNYHFTSELRYWFTYQGGETLTFRGDDDVWVFVNGKLAVDLGGVHGAATGSVTLDSAAAARLGLAAGGMYEIDVFQAERHTSESNYRLTLRGFVKRRSECKSRCGDGIRTRDEACDDGRNDGSYGSCAADCKRRGPYCGDGVLQSAAGEGCDDGNTASSDGCSSTCKLESPR